MYEWSCRVIAAISLNVQRAQMYICYVQQMETVFYLCSNSSSRFSPIWLHAHIHRVCASVNLDQLRKHILGLSMNLFMPVLTEMHFTRNFASSSHSLIRIYSCIHTYIYTYNMYYDRIELTRIFILIWFFFFLFAKNRIEYRYLQKLWTYSDNDNHSFEVEESELIYWKTMTIS